MANNIPSFCEKLAPIVFVEMYLKFRIPFFSFIALHESDALALNFHVAKEDDMWEEIAREEGMDEGISVSLSMCADHKVEIEAVGSGGDERPEQEAATRTLLGASGGPGQLPHPPPRKRLGMEFYDSSDSEPGLRLGISATTRPAMDSSALPRSTVAHAADLPTQDRKGMRKTKRKRKESEPVSPPRDQLASKTTLLSPLAMGEDSTTAAAEDAADSSSEYSSPLHRPMVYKYNSDVAAVDLYHRQFFKHQEKNARLQQLPTLKQSDYYQNIADWHNLNQKSAVLGVANSVLSLSSTHDEKEINCCTGIIIEWDEVSKSATLVTSSQILCNEESQDNSIYYPNTKVIAHLLDGTTSEMELLYFSKHYEIVFFKVNGALDLQVALLDPELEFGSEACVLARDKNLDLICRRTTIVALDPCEHQKNHYLFIDASDCEDCNGGALTNFNRDIVGMVLYALPNVAFIPSSLILKCFRLWKKFRKLGRPHLGLKLRTVNFLDISHLEHLSRVYGISSGLIVAKVSNGSPAERNGIRMGDVIFHCQQESISTTTQFEDVLLDVCEKHFEKGINLNSKVDVEINPKSQDCISVHKYTFCLYSSVFITCASVPGEPSVCPLNYQMAWRSLTKGYGTTRTANCCEEIVIL
uniref:PDZ domain-containing protein n=1 Tax=Oryza punctata TaxID=4537 RepID=A0A0E0KYX1_ORYPU